MSRLEGTVKFFNEDRGFGFITPDGGGKDVFVHIRDLKRSGFEAPGEGDRFSFDTEDSKNGKGPRAVAIRRA